MRRLLLLFLPLSLLAVPAQVILIRNGETSADHMTLSLKGRERATALVPFFQGTPSVLFYGLPAAIFAPESSRETVACLSDALGVPVTQTPRSSQLLANELLTNPDYEGKMILVCCPQEQIVDLATKLGAKKAPKKWSKDAFDRLWTITFEDKEKIAFNDLPQKLLYGDSDK
jgi:hypothetical protein